MKYVMAFGAGLGAALLIAQLLPFWADMIVIGLLCLYLMIRFYPFNPAGQE